MPYKSVVILLGAWSINTELLLLFIPHLWFSKIHALTGPERKSFILFRYTTHITVLLPKPTRPIVPIAIAPISEKPILLGTYRGRIRATRSDFSEASPAFGLSSLSTELSIDDRRHIAVRGRAKYATQTVSINRTVAYSPDFGLVRNRTTIPFNANCKT